MKKLIVFLGVILVCFVLAFTIIKFDHWSRTDPNATWIIVGSIAILATGYFTWDFIAEILTQRKIDRETVILNEKIKTRQEQSARRAAWFVAMDNAMRREGRHVSYGIASQYMQSIADRNLLAQLSSYTVNQLKEIENSIFHQIP